MPSIEKTSQNLLVAASLLLPSTAPALSVDSNAFQSSLGSFERIAGSAPARVWETHLRSIQGTHCIALGKGAFLGAQHVGLPKGAYDVQPLINSEGRVADPVLFRLRGEEHQSVPPLMIAERLNQPKGVLVSATPQPDSSGWSYYAGRGDSPIGFTWRWKTDCFAIQYSRPYLPEDPAYAKIQHNDSGGGVFMYDARASSWTLSGMLLYIPSAQAEAQASTEAFCADLSLETGYGRKILEYRERAPREELSQGLPTTLLAIAAAVTALAAASMLRERKQTAVKATEPPTA